MCVYIFMFLYIYIPMYINFIDKFSIYIQGVTGGTDQASGGCSLY